jgi:hypothetical protein
VREERTSIDEMKHLKIGDYDLSYNLAAYNIIVDLINNDKLNKNILTQLCIPPIETQTTQQLDNKLSTLLSKETNTWLKNKIPEYIKINNLIRETTLSQYLDLGHTENIWYYGIKAENNKDAIVTSDKRILVNNLKKWKGRYIGENEINTLISYKASLGDIAPTWQNKDIKAFLLSDNQINIKEFYAKLKSKILYYMDFGENESIADVQACWIIGTYCYPLFYWYPHILLNAPRESGKSKNAYILMQLAFRGYDIGASAGVYPAQIYRVIEGNRGTILIDEYERNNTETQILVNQLLNASASKDAYIIRNEPTINGGWRPTKFPIYCPKIVCNISGINQTSLTRFIPIHLFRTTSEKGKRKPYREKDKKSFEPIRAEAHVLIMQNWKEIKQNYENIDISLNNRDEDNWLPICAIAKLIGNKVLDNIISYIQHYKEIQTQADDTERELFSTILEKVTEEKSEYTPKQIAEWMGDELSFIKSPTRWIGWKLKKFHLKKTEKSKGSAYMLNKSIIKRIIDAYFPHTENTTNTTNASNTS